jgi:predicted DNA-binding protein
MSTAISVRLPDELVKELVRIANVSEKTLSFIIQKASEIYVQEVADLQEAYDRLQDGDDPLISGKEMTHSLGLYEQAMAHANVEHRTVTGQIEFWAMIGVTALDNPDLPIDFVRDMLMAREEGRAQSTSFVPEGKRLRF